MRWTLFALLLVAAAPSAPADTPGGSPDPVFANIPFDRWSEENQGARWRWETRVSTPVLSQHQRLMIRITVQVDGLEQVKRQGQGRLMMLVQLRDREGRVYQNHSSVSLENVAPEVGRSLSQYVQDAFVVPGDYQVSTGVLVSATSEHVVQRRALHVEALHNDPLPEAWRHLPAVEYIPAGDPPDSWYLPSVEGRLSLPIENKRPVRIDLLVNGSMTEQVLTEQAPRTALLRRARVSVGQLIPAVRVISEIKPVSGSLKIAMLDLERRRVGFEQTVIRDLDWTRLKGALAEADPNVIDVKALENSEQNAQFFLSEMRKRVAASEGAEPLPVLIVLSGPMAFGKADLKPIEAAANRNCKIFYLRYHAMMPMFSRRAPMGINGYDVENTSRIPNRRGVTRLPNPMVEPVDQLFGLIKALDPRLFDVTTPEEFRKALATILSEIARLSNT
jgi:hypothetical protein